MEDALKLIFLSVVQGLGEFLPVSSSGHLVVVERLIAFKSPGPALELFLHVGTLFSIAAFYRKRIASLLLGLLRGERRAAAYAGCILLSMAPTFLAYVAAKDLVDGVFGSARTVAALMVVNGALLLLSAFTDRLRGRGGDVTALRALAMGVGQAIAIVPGISRSGTSIHAGRLAGMPPDKAAEFSFLMSVPVVLGALALQLKEDPSALRCVPPLCAVVCTAVSAAVGYAALRLVVRILERGRLWAFGVWCAALGCAALFFL